MKNKELRKLTRRDLLENLLEQTKRIEELESKFDLILYTGTKGGLNRTTVRLNRV